MRGWVLGSGGKAPPTLDQRADSDRISRALLDEYHTTAATYRDLATKYGVSTQTIFRRLQSARGR